LLDEATSALDNETEKVVQKYLNKIMIGKTSITVAHRLDTVANSNKICLLQKGKIIEQGNYKELIIKK
jgi:ABC-type multidrug transport system fused ATPase/permease subunit